MNDAIILRGRDLHLFYAALAAQGLIIFFVVGFTIAGLVAWWLYGREKFEERLKQEKQQRESA